MPTLNWIGKSAVKEHHREVPFHLLEEHDERSAGDPDAGNLLVQGDNLKALKAFLPRYAGRVKCIYIDPPYNTGNEGWSYNDNVNSPAIRRWLGATVGKEAEDLSRHDKWCCMMYPRLVLLRKLLAADGSFWMSIDDNEVHHARAVLDEVFGAQNFLSDIAWQRKYSVSNNYEGIASIVDRILVYSKTGNFQSNLLPRTSESEERYTNPDDDPRGPWKAVDYLNQVSPEKRPNLCYPITNPHNGEVVTNSKKAWKYKKSVHESHVEEDRLWWGLNGENKVPALKLFLSEVRDGLTPHNWWPHEEVGHTDEAKKETDRILGSNVFATPKPTRLIQRILEIATAPGDLVLDSFAGSGTTGHAVMKQNAKDGGDRRFILVEMEDDVAEGVTAERLRRAVEGYAYEGTETTELLKEKLTVRTLKKMDEVLAETERLKEEHAGEYDGFSRRSKDGHLTLQGKKKIEARKEGLGGGFRYCTLGPALFGEAGLVQEQVEAGDVARHVFYSATNRPLNGAATNGLPLIGTHGDTAVYLLPGAAAGGGDGAAPAAVLTDDVLAGLPPHDGPKIIYGAACQISKERRDAEHITFRQVPYDLRTS